jgi:inosose dehydratase
MQDDRIALNPIQWLASEDGWLDPSRRPDPEDLLTQVRDAGFSGVMAEVPPGWSAAQYLDATARLGLGLAPGYFVCRSDGRDGTEADVIAAASAAARQQAELGQRDVGVGFSMSKDAVRVRHPAQGYEADADRLAAVQSLLARVADAMLAEGVRPALHPHVGTWVETEQEGRNLLDSLPASQLGFLPDTGHLAWAGADVRGLIADYSDRVPFVHVKDCRLSVAARGRENGWTYQQTVLAGLWAEPGRGELPLGDILSPLGADFRGWLIVEVDRPDISDPYQSAQASAAWMHSHAKASS